jgi:hypothetical protein
VRPVIAGGHVIDVVARELTDDRADTVTAVLRTFGLRVELVTDLHGTVNIWAQPTDTIGEVRIISAVKAVTDAPLAYHQAVAT